MKQLLILIPTLLLFSCDNSIENNKRFIVEGVVISATLPDTLALDSTYKFYVTTGMSNGCQLLENTTIDVDGFDILIKSMISTIDGICPTEAKTDSNLIDFNLPLTGEYYIYLNKKENLYKTVLVE